MSTTIGKVGIKKDVKRVSQKAVFSPLMETLTRIGYGARRLIYITMGILAVQVVLGKGGALASPQGAVVAIGKQPTGIILLWVILIGLISYTLWGVVRAVFDPLHKGNDMKCLLARGGFLVSAFGYAIMVLPTYGYITGVSQSTNGSQTQKFISAIMAMPLGCWAIGAGFDRQFQTYALSTKEVKMATDVGRFGTAARGVVLTLVGVLLSLAAYHANPSQPIGMDAALTTLIHQPYGIWLLGIVAVGLVAFGFYSMLSVLWFRLKR